MSCSYTIPDPKNPKNTVESILFKDIYEYYEKLGEPDQKKAEELYKEVKNYKENPALKSFIKNIEPGTTIADENNELLFKHVLEYITRRERKQTIPQPIGALEPTVSVWETKAKELATEISKRASFLKNRKFSTKEKAEVERLKAELLKIESRKEYIKGLDKYITIASKEMAELLDKLEYKDIEKISAQDMQNMSNIVDNYGGIPRVYEDAVSNAAELDKLGISDFKNSVLERLKILEENYIKIKRSYETMALKMAVKSFKDNSHIEYLRENVRGAIVRTEEGKQKEAESDQDYIRRLQKLVDDTIIENHYYSEKERELFFENLFRAGDDISWISRWALQAGNTGSALLRSLNAMISSSEHNARNAYNSKTAQLNSLYQVFKEHMESLGKNTNNTKELYENILEMTENGAYYVGKRKNLWEEHRTQIRKYTQDFVNDLKRKESENTEEEYKFWDIELEEPVDRKDKERYLKLKAAGRGVYNRSYNEFDEGLKNQFEKLKTIQEKRKELYKEKVSKIKEYRQTSSMDKKVRIDQEIEKIVSEIYNLSDTIAGLENELEYFLFKSEYDVLRLPNKKALDALEDIDKKNLKEGKYVSGEERAGTIKVEIPKEVSFYNSDQFKELERLRDKDSKNPIWQYYKGIMQTVAVSERQYSENFRTYFRLPELGKTGAERWEEDVDSILSFNQMWNKYIKPSIVEKYLDAPGYDFDLNYENTVSNEVLQKNGYKISFATKELPVYLKNTGIKLSDQSTNIQHVTLAGFNSAIAYSEKYKILPYIQMFLYLLEIRKMSATSGGAQLLQRITSNLSKSFGKSEDYLERITEDQDKVGKSNLYKNALDAVNTRLFGQAVNDTLNISIALPFTEYRLNIRKLFKVFMGGVSLSVLSGNIKSGIANVIYGEFQFLQEALGNEYVSPKSWGKAQLIYLYGSRGLINDIGKDYPTSKINLLGLIFDPLNDYNPLESHYKYTNKSYAVFNSNSLQGVNSIGEHIMHQGTMLAVLEETKVLDKDGNYLTLNNTTKERDKGISLFEAFNKISEAENSYEVDTDKRIAFIEVKRGDRFVKLPFKGGDIHKYKISQFDYEQNSKAINYLTNIIQGLNEEMHGPYSWRTAPPMKRTMIGSALLHMRQWFPKGMEIRWQGFTNELYAAYAASKKGKLSDYWQDVREGTPSERYFDESLRLDFINKGPSAKYNPKFDAPRSGRNATFFRQGGLLGYHFILKIKQLFGAEIEDAQFLQDGLLKITKDQWKNMSANEKANIKKVVMTTASRVLLSAFATALLSGDDDEDKYYKLAFYTVRLHTELAAYSDLGELFRIMQSPAVTLSMVQRMYKLMAQLSEDMYNGEFEVYQSGSKKGRTKAGKALRDVLPWGNLLQQHRYIEDILNYHYKDQAGLVKN